MGRYINVLVTLAGASVAGALSFASESRQQDCVNVFADPKLQHTPCYVIMQRVMTAGFSDQEMHDFQQYLFDNMESGCPRPCEAEKELPLVSTAKEDSKQDLMHPKEVVDESKKNIKGHKKQAAHPKASAASKNAKVLEVNPCMDPKYPVAAHVGDFLWCFVDHGHASKHDAPCDSWCTLDTKSGDRCDGCCGDIKDQLCKSQELEAEMPAGATEFHGLDFFGSHVAENNLGGMGPAQDPVPAEASSKQIRLKHVDDVNGMVDLVIANLSAYAPDDSAKNGLSDDGYWAKVNLKCDTSTTLRFSFLDSHTGEPVTLQEFYFTIADIDEAFDGNCRESVQPNGYLDFALSSTSQLTQAEHPHGRIFTSNAHGNVVDSPTSNQLTTAQEDRAIGFLYRHVQSFTVTIATEKGKGPGRNLYFGGTTSMTPTS